MTDSDYDALADDLVDRGLDGQRPGRVRLRGHAHRAVDAAVTVALAGGRPRVAQVGLAVRRGEHGQPGVVVVDAQRRRGGELLDEHGERLSG